MSPPLGIKCYDHADAKAPRQPRGGSAEAKRGRTNDLCVRGSTYDVGGMARMPTARLFDFIESEMKG